MVLERTEPIWTYEDLVAMPDDGKRYEIIEGELFELPGPNMRHAKVLMNLVFLLGPLVDSLEGDIYASVLDVFFPGANPVEPDLVVLLPSSSARQVERGVVGPPDLAVEVISPSKRTHDILTKRALYGRGGVREYWLVDPEARTVEVIAFAPGGIGTGRVFSTDETVRSSLLAVEFPASRVFAGFERIAAE